MARSETDGGGLTRRSLLSRAVIAGGVVWAAPVIASTPAYAGGKGDGKGKGTQVPCTKFYAARITPSGVEALFDDKKKDYAGGICPELSAFVRDHPDISFGPPAGGSKNPQLLSSAPNFDWAILLPAGIVPDPAYSARLIMGFGLAGDTCCPGYTDPSPPDATQIGRRVLFPQCGKDPISEVQVIYCSP